MTWTQSKINTVFVTTLSRTSKNIYLMGIADSTFFTPIFFFSGIYYRLQCADYLKESTGQDVEYLVNRSNIYIYLKKIYIYIIITDFVIFQPCFFTYSCMCVINLDWRNYFNITFMFNCCWFDIYDLWKLTCALTGSESHPVLHKLQVS